MNTNTGKRTWSTEKIGRCQLETDTCVLVGNRLVSSEFCWYKVVQILHLLLAFVHKRTRRKTLVWRDKRIREVPKRTRLLNFENHILTNQRTLLLVSACQICARIWALQSLSKWFGNRISIKYSVTVVSLSDAHKNLSANAVQNDWKPMIGSRVFNQIFKY